MNNLKIAVQKSGRLKDDSMKLLKDIGISIDNGKDQLKATRYLMITIYHNNR
jgi:ATP phosphoribosyltransferase